MIMCTHVVIIILMLEILHHYHDMENYITIIDILIILHIPNVAFDEHCKNGVHFYKHTSILCFHIILRVCACV